MVLSLHLDGLFASEQCTMMLSRKVHGSFETCNFALMRRPV